MLGFLFRRRDVRRRCIFHFRAGGVRRHADPIQVDQALTRHGGPEWTRLVGLVDSLRRPMTPAIAAARGPNAAAEQKRQFDAALADLVGIVRKAFGLAPLDPLTGDGVTDAECVAVLTEYLNYAEQLAEDARPLA